jgi:hypothetical protein
MLIGVICLSFPPQRTTNWTTSRSGRATPARARTAERPTIDQARARMNGTRPAEAGPRPSCQAASAMHTSPAAARARPPQCGSSRVDAASFTSVRSPVCSSAIGSRQMFGVITFASPDAVSITPYTPMNCQRDQGARPPSAATVMITPTRLRNERKKTRASPRKARPEPFFASAGCCTPDAVSPVGAGIRPRRRARVGSSSGSGPLAPPPERCRNRASGRARGDARVLAVPRVARPRSAARAR